MIRLLIVLLAVVAVGDCRAACQEVKLVGHYFNTTWTNDEDPHLIDGYEVDLYKCANRLFGEIAIATGTSEAVSARLYDIDLEEGTGRLTFKAKYSSGQEFSKKIGPGGREARSILAFVGTLSRRRLQGIFVVSDAYTNLVEDKPRRHVLKRDNDNGVPKTADDFVKSPPVPAW